MEHPRQHLYQCGKGPTLHGTPGAQIVAELQPLKSEIVIIKKRFSAFFNTPLDCILRRWAVPVPTHATSPPQTRTIAHLFMNNLFPNCGRGTFATMLATSSTRYKAAGRPRCRSSCTLEPAAPLCTSQITATPGHLLHTQLSVAGMEQPQAWAQQWHTSEVRVHEHSSRRAVHCAGGTSST